MNKKLSVTALAIAIGAASSGVQAQDLEERISALEDSPLANTNFDVGGFVKLDSHLTRATDGSSSASQDFLVPSLIPDGGDNSNLNYNSNANLSRIFFKTDTDTDIGNVGTYIEMDFRPRAGGEENLVSGYQPRLRHAFMTFNDFTIGQTWSTFHDVSVLPENLDFVGPVGTIFNRQAQIRYSPGNWDFAIENPQSNLQNNAGVETNFDSGSMPDLVARYNVPLDSGHASVAVLGREVSYEQDNFEQDLDVREKAFGYGVSLSAKMPIGNEGSDIRAQLNAGNLGRYIALGAFDPGYIDNNGDIELIDQMGGYVSYRQAWTPQWRSNFTVSHVTSDNDDEMGDEVIKSASSAHANLIYSPISNLDLGGEVIWGDKELENGSNGELHRLQFTAKLGF